MEGETQDEALGSTTQTCEEAASADRGEERVRGLGEEAAGIETSRKRFGDQERRAA